jgi:two-component system chemotaxis sensor kinase CheA
VLPATPIAQEPIVAEPAVEPATTAVESGENSATMAAPVGVTPTIRVDLEKLDRLVNLVGELVITQAMLAQRLLNCGLASISELSDLDHLTRELQDSAMSIRAQPIRSVFNRVPRIVRELQASTGKRVRLEVEGEATELDKTVVERIGEPLTHLIRNAIDHGLETPEERIFAGKEAEGLIRLSAEHRSGRIVICVSDDGRGIDHDRVYAKAVERGLVAPDAKMSDEEIENLIFAPGFSTAATLSNISGRGVGMDVVRRNVQSLGGRIAIASKPGLGSTFTLSLPLTLAILDGMIVSIGDQTYVIPLTHIIESLRPLPEEVKRIGINQSMINIRGSWLPIQSVAGALGIAGAQTDPSLAVLIVVESENGQAVLMIDEILDQRQVVIKSLETNYRQVEGVAGATILGDGRVALILDVESVTSGMRPQGDAAIRARA